MNLANILEKLQFAQHIGNQMHQKGFPDAQVKAVIYCRLNNRPPALLIDPEVDLTAVSRNLFPAPWTSTAGESPLFQLT